MKNICGLLIMGGILISTGTLKKETGWGNNPDPITDEAGQFIEELISNKAFMEDPKQ